jgi:ribonuclease E
MAKKMLIDASHPEESRVAIIDGNRLEDYEAETSTKQHFKGNIYLAKVIRIEPSLQAAFVEYGHDRHGFLPFAEIHPDYYRIPVGDRPIEIKKEEPAEEDKPIAEALPEVTDGEVPDVPVITDANDDEDSITAHRPQFNYKIQEVIKRRQIMLIQVVKDERGNKGAALTTYLSLPGRYCVLMPNAGHRSGGISRKITDANTRKRLRDILNELPIPDAMSLIVRTAGQDRNKLEIRRDFEYLVRLWSDIRDKTMASMAPAMIYEEGDVIKRSIRDNYSKDIDEVWIDGDEGYKQARAMMKTLTPSHVKRVKQHKGEVSLFQKFGVESHIDAIMTPTATLPSGGSIVINPTEALVAIDVNSGKATRERHIDETALKTNLEAADEVARQIKLRDLGGLVVIDFIDMSDSKHIQQVEKRLKDAIKGDRARIQMGRISQFGLLELSRQRLRPSIVEANMRPCTHCHGTGMVRSIESMALFVLRGIESAGVAGKSEAILVTVPADIDLYLLNQKRSNILALEARYEMSVMIQRDSKLVAPDFKIETTATRSKPRVKAVEIEEEPEIEDDIVEDMVDEVEEVTESEESGERKQRGRRNPFQRRRGKDRRDRTEQVSEDVTAAEPTEASVTTEEQQDEERPSRNRRRRNRNRNRNRTDRTEQDASAAPAESSAPSDEQAEPGEKSEKSGRNRRRRRKPNRPQGDDATQSGEVSSAASEESQVEGEATGDGKKRRRGFWRRLLEA